MRYIVFRKNRLQKISPYIKFVIATALIFLVLKVFVLEFYKIPTESMQPTLFPGEHVVGLKIAYGIKMPFTNIYFKVADPEHGDVVSLKRDGDKLVYIKRVIALPMESFAVKTGNFVVSGRSLKRNYTAETAMYKYLDQDNVVYDEQAFNKKYHVAYSNKKRIQDTENSFVCSNNGYFVAGDNRSNSMDSRKWGEIKRANILSKVVFIFFSMDPDTGKIRWDRIGLVH